MKDAHEMRYEEVATLVGVVDRIMELLRPFPRHLQDSILTMVDGEFELLDAREKPKLDGGQ